MGGHVFAEGEEGGCVVDCGGEGSVGWHCDGVVGEMMGWGGRGKGESDRSWEMLEMYFSRWVWEMWRCGQI